MKLLFLGLKVEVFFLNKFIYFYFIYFWLRWVVFAVREISQVAVSGGYSSLLCAGFSLVAERAGATLRCGMRASHCGGFSCCRARALGLWAQ